MSLIEPPGGDDDLFAALESQFDDNTTAEIEEGAVDFTKLTDLEVSTMFHDVREGLLERGEMLNPTTDEGRLLHSQRAALLVEMARRNLR